MKKKIVSVYSLIHFIVDLASITCVLNLVKAYSPNLNNSIMILTVIIYNFCGFALQMPIGAIADKLNKNALVSASGCIFVLIGYIFFKNPIFAAILSGIGNSLFHVGGGIDVLNICDKKATLSGIYVSTGALGVFLGTKSLSWGFNKYWIMILLLVFAFFLLLKLYNDIKGTVSNVPVKLDNLNINAYIAIACIFITVALRSYVGMILSFEWKQNLILAFASIFAVIFGKMLGGIIGDKIGFEKISISLIISAICFIFAFDNPIFGIIAILLFNMTMPITLTCLSNILENNKGLAFGLLTVALFVGYLPFQFGILGAFTKIGLFCLTVLSSLILFIALINYNKVIKIREEN